MGFKILGYALPLVELGKRCGSTCTCPARQLNECKEAVKNWFRANAPAKISFQIREDDVVIGFGFLCVDPDVEVGALPVRDFSALRKTVFGSLIPNSAPQLF